MNPNQVVILNKPFGVQCKFTDTEGRPTLADFLDIPNIYPAGRLDSDSEGLVLLTGSGPLQHRISHPDNKLEKTYLAQVEGEITDDAVRALQNGVVLADGPTRLARVRQVDPPELWERNPPIRFRKSVPDSWVRLTISEGRNRQVRRMTAAVGFPTLRLVRISIGEWALGELGPGEWRLDSVPASLLREFSAPTTRKDARKTGRGFGEQRGRGRR